MEKQYSLSDLGLAIEESKVLRWKAAVNTVVLKSQPLLELDINGATLLINTSHDLLLLSTTKTGVTIHPAKKIFKAIPLNELKSNVDARRVEPVVSPLREPDQVSLAEHQGISKENIDVSPNSEPQTRQRPHQNSTAHKLISSLSTPGFKLTKEDEEGLLNCTKLLHENLSFQSIDVIERIVAYEQARIEDEQTLWRIGGAILGAALGAGDGFGLADVGTSFAFSNIAGMAHSQASKEQREFLKKIHSLWLVDQRSPFDLRRRLGEPIGRFIGYSSLANSFNPDDLYIASIHQNSSRGFTAVSLGFAGDNAAGFIDNMSREKMAEVFTGEEIETLKCQFYPIIENSIPLKLVRSITEEEAKSKDPLYSYLRKTGSPYRISIGDGDDDILYKCAIPSHSDF